MGVGNRNYFLQTLGALGGYGMLDTATAPVKSPKKALLIEDFPANLKLRAKVVAALAGLTLRHLVINSVEAAVAAAEKNAARKRARASAKQ